ncbi:MAG: hypothetical protein WDM89_12075 [Rhizomicrobium sp.]
MTFQTRHRLFAGRSGQRKREGDARAVTYLVCGLRGLAGLASSFRDDPAALIKIIESLLSSLTGEVQAHRGTIEHLSGEGFSAFWNAPHDDPDHAIHACEAANATMRTASARERRFLEAHCTRHRGSPRALRLQVRSMRKGARSQPLSALAQRRRHTRKGCPRCMARR